jgi:polyvinyl alcohol dehydrogenase (cytochrome)
VKPILLGLSLTLLAAAQDKSGADLFKQRCAVCHVGDTNPRAPNLDALKTRTPDAILTALVSGSMRVQGSRVSGPERRAIAEYITGKQLSGDVTGSASGRCASRPAFKYTAGWNGWGPTATNTRFQPGPAAGGVSGISADDVPRLKLKWAFGFPDATVAWSQPAVAGGRVFVGSQNGTVFSLDARSGCIYWTFSAQGGVRTAISVDAKQVYFGDTSANVYALDASTGAKVWVRKVDDHPLARVTGSPVLYEGRLYVPTSSYEEAQGADADYECCSFRGSVSALNAATGAVLWKTYTIDEKPQPRGKSANGVTLWGPSGAAIWSSPTVDAKRGVVYAGTGNTYSDSEKQRAGSTSGQPRSDAIVAFDMKTGVIKWSKQITPGDTFVSGCRTGSTNPNCPATNGPDFDFGNSPILTTVGGRDMIIVGQKSGVGFALDPDKQGEVIWQYRAGQGGALGGLEWGSAVDTEQAYFAVSDISRPAPGGLHAVNLATGERVWAAPPPPLKCTAGRGCNAAQTAAISVIPGVVFSGSNDGALRAYSTKDGSIIWEFDTNRDFETVNAVPAKGASMQGPGPAVAGGMLYTNAGYGAFGGRPGNVLLAFDTGIDTSLIDISVLEKYREQVLKQAADPEMKRVGGTIAADWPYTLPVGVTTRQITYYSDGAPCYAKLFLPRGFTKTGHWPAVVLGHGFNGISIGIEKYGARFADRGLVALVIDYRTYGTSMGLVSFLDPDKDKSNDSKSLWEQEARVQLKRTRLNAFKQADDYRAAISYIQGEPGVDPAKIGVWGSSYSGANVINLSGIDARVKAVVSQVIAVGGRGSIGPVPLSPAGKEDEIKRARTGQGAEIDGGFSFRTKIDAETNQTGRESRPWQSMQHTPESTAILWLPAEKDELSNDKSPTGAFEASKNFKGTSLVVEIPGITHFQAYNGPAFEVTSTLAANWFLKYLAEAGPGTPSKPAPPLPRLPVVIAQKTAVPSGVTTKDVHYFSEGVECYGELFLPAGFDASGKTAAVVLAPGWGETHESLSRFAGALAEKGMVAMAIDYRGWGKSGGYLYTADRIYQDDRFRFLQTTARIKILRRRIIPQHQVEDLRAALAYIAGEPGVDAARIGVAGEGLAGAHVLSVAEIDGHVKAGVAIKPGFSGQFSKDVPEKVQPPPANLLAAQIKFARMGVAPDSRYAMWDYRPFQNLSWIPKSTSMLMDATAMDDKVVEWLVKNL